MTMLEFSEIAAATVAPATAPEASVREAELEPLSKVSVLQ